MLPSSRIAIHEMDAGSCDLVPRPERGGNVAVAVHTIIPPKRYTNCLPPELMAKSPDGESADSNTVDASHPVTKSQAPQRVPVATVAIRVIRTNTTRRMTVPHGMTR